MFIEKGNNQWLMSCKLNSISFWKAEQRCALADSPNVPDGLSSIPHQKPCTVHCVCVAPEHTHSFTHRRTEGMSSLEPRPEGLMSSQLITAFRCVFACCGQHKGDLFHYTSQRHQWSKSPACQIICQWCHNGYAGLEDMLEQQSSPERSLSSDPSCVSLW